MKEFPAPYQVMESLAGYINRAYRDQREKQEGVIQFHLTYKNERLDCYLRFAPEGVSLSKGVAKDPAVTVKSTLYHWLDLAAGRLNPLIGILTGKLRFSGDTSFFSKVMSEEIFGTDISEYDDPVTDFEKRPHKYWRIPERVLVLNASPRAGQGYTEFYLEAFLRGLGKTCASIDMVYLAEQRINRCRGCWYCWLSGTGNCVFKDKDDFEKINQRYEDADLVVFAFPLYIDGMPSLLKDFLERTVCHYHPYMIRGHHRTRHPRRKRKKQAVVVFSVSGFPELDNFRAVKEHFRQITHNSHQPIVAEIYRPAGMYLYNNPLLYRELNEVMEALEMAGEEVGRYGKLSRKTLKVIQQRIDRVSDFRRLSNLFWKEKIRDNDRTY
ncbi:MAG: hypothetical protein GXO97_09380 [Nitrospirae bacterium]|nr:hypothetical protein [Nitrospirota bacterium]